jgi:hypothetical protein
MFAMNRLRLPIAFIVGGAFAALLAFAAFSTLVEAHQDDTSGEQTDAAATEAANPDEVTIQNHAWSTYHWARQSNPVTLELGDNVNSTWDSYLRSASDVWSRPPNTAWPDVIETTVVDPGGTAADPKKCTPTMGRVEVCNARYGQNGWLGLAQISIDSTGHIVRGTSKMNDTYFNMTKYNNIEWRSHVMCQEVGHTFALGHQDTSGKDFHTCMDYASSPDGDNRVPNQHDYEQLGEIYNNHTDNNTTTKPTSSATKVHPNDRAAWGKLKFRSPNNHTEIYEREFSNGEKLVTFVELADPEDQPGGQQKKQEKKQGQPQEEEKQAQ